MAIKAVEGLAPSWYVPTAEVGEEEPTRFKLKPLNREQLDSVLEGAAQSEQGGLKLTARGVGYALRFGLIDWENFNNAQDKPVKFSPANFIKMPWSVGIELAGEIVNQSFMSEEDEKNY